MGSFDYSRRLTMTCKPRLTVRGPVQLKKGNQMKLGTVYETPCETARPAMRRLQ
jgi:hypothetical protein